MTHRLTGTAQGVYAIAATPFTDAGALDVEGIDRLTDFYLGNGVDGLTILGVMGEAQKLSDAEARLATQTFLAGAQGRVPVIVGVSNPGLAGLAALARHAMEHGAAGVMVQPVAGLKTEDQVLRYMAQVVEALGPDVPVCFQDYPQLSGVYVSTETLLRLVAEHDTIVMVKHEEAPGLAKLSRLKSEASRRISVLCGNGGLHLPQEYRRGADGAMTGFAYPDMLVAMDRLFRAGRHEDAEDLYDLYLPVLRHEAQPGIGLAIRKDILRRRGALTSAAVRRPGPRLSAADLVELDVLLHRLERKLALAG